MQVEVINCLSQQCGVVVKTAEAVVAFEAQEIPDRPSSVVVIDVEAAGFSCGSRWGLAADCTFTILRNKFSLVVLHGYAVFIPGGIKARRLFIGRIGVPFVGDRFVAIPATIIPWAIGNKLAHWLGSLAAGTNFFTGLSFWSLGAGNLKMSLKPANRHFFSAEGTGQKSPWAKLLWSLRANWSVAKEFAGVKFGLAVFACADYFGSTERVAHNPLYGTI
jgi:hypothetical protein